MNFFIKLCGFLAGRIAAENGIYTTGRTPDDLAQRFREGYRAGRELALRNREAAERAARREGAARGTKREREE